jgi:deoxyhypusine synthase
MYEVDQRPVKRPQKRQEPVQLETIQFTYPIGNETQEYFFSYTCNLYFDQSDNIESYSVYINDNYYGDDVNEIQINTDDNLRIDIIKSVDGESTLSFSQKLI